MNDSIMVNYGNNVIVIWSIILNGDLVYFDYFEFFCNNMRTEIIKLWLNWLCL